MLDLSLCPSAGGVVDCNGSSSLRVFSPPFTLALTYILVCSRRLLLQLREGTLRIH
jgi:hypothetical protein